jgi:hypothetical protein
LAVHLACRFALGLLYFAPRSTKWAVVVNRSVERGYITVDRGMFQVARYEEESRASAQLRANSLRVAISRGEMP